MIPALLPSAGLWNAETQSWVAPTFIGKVRGTFGATAGGDLHLEDAGAVVAGDFAIASACFATTADRDMSAIISSAGGSWTIAEELHYMDEGLHINLVVAYRFLDSTDIASDIVTFGPEPLGASTNGAMQSLLIYRGVNPTTPLDATSTFAESQISTINPAAITTVTPNSRVVSIGATGSDFMSTPSVSATGNLTARETGGTQAGSTRRACMGAGDAVQAVAGSFDPTIWTQGVIAAVWTCATLALRGVLQ